MEKLFGLKLGTLMVALIIIFALCVAGLIISALRNRVMFKIAVRNIPRRPAQTGLILLGLMLGAALISASLTTGDTLSYSIRLIATDILGEVDIIVNSEVEDVSGRPDYFAEARFQEVRDTLADKANVAGVAPLITEEVPALNPNNELSEPTVELLGMDPQYMGGFDSITDKNGHQLPSVEELGDGEIYISKKAADNLEAQVNDQVQLFLGTASPTFTVKGIYEKGANPALSVSALMPLSKLQALMNRAGEINTIIITNKGGAVAGAEHSKSVMSTLEPSLEGTGLKAEAVKNDVLKEAESAGNMFSGMFLMMAQFSITAGILLIFLIFVMLAAERKRELGIARAVGTQRGQIIRMFTFEGVLYGLIASALGAVLGMALGWGMVRIMAAAFEQMDFGQMDFRLVYHFNRSSLIIAYTMGVLLTLAVVLFSSWRVSRLNIVRAVRDIPDPQRSGARGIKGLIIGIVAVFFGLLMLAAGILTKSASPYLTGGSLLLIGVLLILRKLGLPDRATFTITGAGLLAWWLIPLGLHPAADKMTQTMDLFFLSGIMTVAGMVWVVIYNSDILLSAVMSIFGRIQKLAPILKTAVSYPMANRFRTGMALAMFCLVIFTMVVMSTVNNSMNAWIGDTDRMSGGFDIYTTVNYNNPIPDIHAAVEQADKVKAEDFSAISSINTIMMEGRQADTKKEQEWAELTIQGVDSVYVDNTTYDFAMMAEDYSSAEEIWQALGRDADVVAVSSALAKSRVNYNMGEPMSGTQLEGFVREDKKLPETYLELRQLGTEDVHRVRVIGVLEDAAVLGAMITTSQSTLNGLFGTPVPPTTYLFQVKPEVSNVSKLANNLETQFLGNGMNTTVPADEAKNYTKVQDMFNLLIQAFLGMGLVVGIAALGVIAARAVVERRQEIGVLRAIGFQRGTVQLSFLVEYSFIALLGIGLGILLGLAISAQVVSDISNTVTGLHLVVPWTQILAIVAIAYLASLTTTFLPAYQASRVYPAEALRYE